MERIKLKNLITDRTSKYRHAPKYKYEIRYYDKEVVCKALYIFQFDDLLSMPFDFQTKMETKYGEGLNLCANYLELTVKATARCSGKDEFDINKGKKIAKIKTDQKMFDIVGRIFADYEKRITKEMELAYNYKAFFEYMSNHEKKYIESL